MNRLNDFIERLTEITDPVPLPNHKNCPAAALLGILKDTPERDILLTRRALHLRHHPGQISFPGGRVEPGENLIEAAIRESYEEVRLPPETIHVIGSLPPIRTTSGFQLHTIVAFIHGHPQLQPAPEEVDTIVHFPFRKAVCEHYWHSEIGRYHGTVLRYHVCWHNRHLIWGATARVLSEFRTRWHRRWPDQ